MSTPDLLFTFLLRLLPAFKPNDAKAHHFCHAYRQMQKWEYKVFASHLDPAELVVILDSSGREGWELVALVGVIDEVPPDLLNPVEVAKGASFELGAAKPTQAFRYIFKRPLN